MINVTIIMPVYNCADLVTRALDSIPENDNIEVICIDDCSTDDSYKILKNYKRLNLKVFQTEKNSGPGTARNIGYDNAEGEWIFGLDSDDYMYGDQFIKLLNDIINHRFDSYDLIHTLINVNNGRVWGTKCECVAVHTYLVRRVFVGKLRMPEQRRGEDELFLDAIRAKGPRECLYSHALVHYDWGIRPGSICYQYQHGMLDEKGYENKTL